MYLHYLLYLVPDTSYLHGSEVFCSFPAQAYVEVRKDICSATASLPRTIRADSAEALQWVCALQTVPDDVGKFFRILKH